MRTALHVGLGVAFWIGVAATFALLVSNFGAPPDPNADAGAGGHATKDEDDAGVEHRVDVVASSEVDPTEVAVDDDAVYWLDAPYGTNDGSPHRAANDG